MDRDSANERFEFELSAERGASALVRVRRRTDSTRGHGLSERAAAKSCSAPRAQGADRGGEAHSVIIMRRFKTSGRANGRGHDDRSTGRHVDGRHGSSGRPQRGKKKGGAKSSTSVKSSSPATRSSTSTPLVQSSPPAKSSTSTPSNQSSPPEILLMTCEDVLFFGLDLVGFDKERQDVRTSLLLDRFMCFFGPEPRTVKDLLSDLRDEYPDISFKDVMMTMNWAKRCK